jgi:phosphoglycolate phosphatase
VSNFAVLNGATIAFDLDGTLVDSAPDLIGAVNTILVEEGYKPIPYEQARPMVSGGARGLLQWGLSCADVDDPTSRATALFDRLIRYYRGHIADRSRPFPGAIGAIERLRAVGARTVVCTNKPTGISLDLLSKLGMAQLFDAVVGADAVSAIKPNGAHLIEAVTAVSGELARAVMVGDAAPDVGAARAAGTPLVLVDFGYSETPVAELCPDILLHHFDELFEACAALLEHTRTLHDVS